MPTTYSYWYTIQTFMNWAEGVTNDGLTIQVASAYFDLSTTPTWVQLSPEATTLTVSNSKFTVQANCEVKFVIKFYMKNDSTGQIYWMSSDHVNNIKVNFSNYSGKLKNTTPTVQFQTGASSNISGVIGSGSAWWFSVIPSQSGFTMGPSSFSLSADVVADVSGAYGGNTDTSTHTPSLGGYNPVIVVAGAKQVPPTPNDFITAMQTFAGYGQTPYVFNKCDNMWHGIAITQSAFNGVTGKSTYTFQKYVCNANNTGIKKDGSPVTESPAVPGKKDTTALTVARAQLQSYALGDCSGLLIGKKAGVITDQTNSTPANATVTTPPTTDDNWNPPTYVGSRYASYAEMMSLLTADSVVPSTEGGLETAIDILYISSKNNQGKIFQDSASAAALNKYQTHLSLKAQKTKNQWGFKFMYNPTSFSYSTSSNNSVDFTNGANDPSALLVGNQQVTFELYLNRILDLNYLQKEIMQGNNDVSKGYGRNLTDPEKYGILYRGTEYDIEFLYRVLNGNPAGNSLLLSDEYNAKGGATADFGYTTAVPCWLWLNDNLRYFGAVASIQVNHVMFDLRMVPILSVVNITFSRYPALWKNSTIAGLGESKVSSTAANNAAGVIAGTGTGG